VNVLCVRLMCIFNNADVFANNLASLDITRSNNLSYKHQQQQQHHQQQQQQQQSQTTITNFVLQTRTILIAAVFVALLGQLWTIGPMTLANRFHQQRRVEIAREPTPTHVEKHIETTTTTTTIVQQQQQQSCNNTRKDSKFPTSRAALRSAPRRRARCATNRIDARTAPSSAWATPLASGRAYWPRRSAVVGRERERERERELVFVC
jgi:hypothetical protein